MKILLVLCIIFLAYLSIGLIYFLLVFWDEAMNIINDGKTSKKDQYISILLTILRYTPYNIVNHIKRLFKKDK